MTINIYSIYRPFLKYFRTKRMRTFQNVMSPYSTTTILDVGGTGFIWKLVPVSSEISILNHFFSNDLL